MPKFDIIPLFYFFNTFTLTIKSFLEPCPSNFTRVGSDCYHFGSEAGREYDWKVASKQCKKLGGFLAETEGIDKMKELTTYIISNSYLSGKQFL